VDGWPVVVTPLVVLALLLVVRLVGCGLDVTGTAAPSYRFAIINESDLVSYWRLGEPNGTAVNAQAKDEKNVHHGTYRTVTLAGNAALLSPSTANPPVLDGGEVSLHSAEPGATSFRFDGGFVRVPWKAALNPPKFTVEAVVHPFWPAAQAGVFRCVLASREDTGPGGKKHGYIIYAGPVLDPTTAQVVDAAMHWQAWVGTGVTGQQWQWVVSETPVAMTPTYLAATYDGTALRFFAINDKVKDMDMNAIVKSQNVAYSPNPGKPLYIAMGAPERAVPNPGPLYPFNGLIQDVAVYKAALPFDPNLKNHLRGSTGF
jgi:hypothetical protein